MSGIGKKDRSAAGQSVRHFGIGVADEELALGCLDDERGCVTMTDELMTPPQAGRALGVDTYEVLVLMDRGDLPRVKGADGLLYVPTEAVAEYARTHS